MAEQNKAKKPSAEVLDKALHRVTMARDAIQTQTSELRDNWLRYYELTRRFRVVSASTHNRVFVPRCWEIVEKIAPRMTAHDPKFDMIPLRNRALPYVEIVSDILDFMWSEKQLKRETRLWSKESLRYGTGFVKVNIDSKTVTEIVEQKVIEEEEQFNPETGEIEIVEIEEIVEEEIEISALPYFEVVDIFDIDVDPRFKSVDAAPEVIHSRENVSITELYLDEDMYFNLDELEMYLNAPPENDDITQKEQIRGVTTGERSDRTGGEDSDLNNLVVREFWGLFSPTGKAADQMEYVITVVNDSVVIRCEENPFITEECPNGVRPIEYLNDHDVPNELYGIGEVEPVETLQYGINKMRNQRLDNVDFVMNRMWLAERTAGINPDDLISTPGNIIEVDDLQGIQSLATPDVTSSSYQEENVYNRDFQLATSTIDSTGGGGADDFVNTATGQKIRSKEQNARFALKIENLEDALARVGMKMLKMMVALADEEIVIRRKNEDGGFKFTKVNGSVFKEAVEGMAVKVKAGSTISDDYAERRDQAIARWNLAGAAVNAGVISADELKEIWNELDRVAFGGGGVMKGKVGGGLEQLKQKLAGAGEAVASQQGAPQLDPAATQISPETLVPNGLQPGMPLNIQ